jgi:hypothetical protein
MKKIILLAIVLILITSNLHAKYPKEQLVVLQDNGTAVSSMSENNGAFAWVSTYNKEIFYYDCFQTHQITNTNNQGNKTILDFEKGEIFFQDVWYDYSNGDTQQLSALYIYKDGNLIDLKDNTQCSWNGYKYGNRICWEGGTNASSTSDEVYLYDNGITNRITNNNYLERNPKLNNDYLVWDAMGNSDVENKFYIYKDGNTTALSVDILGYYYLLNNKGIVWQGCDGGPNCNESMRDLDHEIFFYDFDKVKQITDTPDRIETDYRVTDKLIFVISENADGQDPKLSIYNYEGEMVFEFQISTININTSMQIKDDSCIFSTSNGPNEPRNLYFFDGTTLQMIDSGLNLNYGFAFGGIGYSYGDDQGNYATYLYKDGTKELIFNDINSIPYFFDNYLVYLYAYPNIPAYKLTYLDPNLPYIQLTGNEAHRLFKGNTLKMNLTVRNPGPDKAVDIYIAEISGEDPFQMIRFFTPDGFKFQLYGYKNVLLPKDLDLSFEFYSAKIGDIPDAPLSKVSYMVIPTHAGTFIPLTAFPSTLSYELVK